MSTRLEGRGLFFMWALVVRFMLYVVRGIDRQTAAPSTADPELANDLIKLLESLRKDLWL